MSALEHLMGAYFHQDWDTDGGAVSDTVMAFVAGAPLRVEPAVAEIDELLGASLREGDLRGRLEAMGCDYYAGESDADYRAWLIDIRALLVSSRQHPS